MTSLNGDVLKYLTPICRLLIFAYHPFWLCGRADVIIIPNMLNEKWYKYFSRAIIVL